MFVNVMRWNLIEISMERNSVAVTHRIKSFIFVKALFGGEWLAWHILYIYKVLKKKKIAFIVYALIYDLKKRWFLVAFIFFKWKKFESGFQLLLSRHAVILMDVLFLFKLRKELYPITVFLNYKYFYFSWKYRYWIFQR